MYVPEYKKLEYIQKIQSTEKDKALTLIYHWVKAGLINQSIYRSLMGLVIQKEIEVARARDVAYTFDPN